MKIVLCLVAGIFACLHAYAAIAHMRKNQNKTNDIFMIAGAVIAMLGIALCFANHGIDWIIALVGFAFIAYAAIQNGRKNQNFHIQHHIVRIAVLAVLTIGFFCL